MAKGYAEPMLALFPSSATVEDGELALGGVRASALADEFGTPLVVYCEQTIVEAARAYREAAPGALLVYGTKAFPNVAILRLLAAEGLGADVASLGELELARRAGIDGDKLVVHGNNKSDEELRAAAEAGALVVVDALDEVERAAAAGVRRALVRVTPGIEADTHEAIRTAHHGSKFGLPPEDALAAVRALREAGIEVEGLHTHIGSQLVHLRAAAMTVEWLSLFATRCRVELDWTPATIDLGGGLGVAHVEEEQPPSIADFVSAIAAEVERWWGLQGLGPPRLVFEPGRSLVGRAGVTLYRVGSVKRASESTTYVAVDGGISDNPRPALYGAQYSALLGNRAAEEPSGPYAVAGKHCESGDVLIHRVQLPEPRRGDLLAVPATGGYTLAMASNYNATLRPAAVLVADGEARLIRRRETIEDLLALEQ
jgi:diaminopimelate decarboxylase